MDGLTSELYLISAILVHPPKPNESAAWRATEKGLSIMTLLRLIKVKSQFC